MSLCPSKEYLVSAIVSTYNAERFLRGKLEDLEAQTIAQDLEIIVVDSGSQQDEGRIVAEFQERYDNIRYLRTQERETVYQAWNRGVRLATGEFLTNSNTDDRLRHDCLETLVRALHEHPECVLAYSDIRSTEQENATFEAHLPLGFRKWPPYDRLNLLELCCVGPFPLWRRSLHEKIGYFDERYGCSADYEFWLRASQSHDFIHVPQFLGLYWLSDKTVSRSTDLATLEYLQIQKEYRPKFAHFAPPPAALPPGELKLFQALAQRLSALDSSPHPTAGTEEAIQELERFIEHYPAFPAAHHELAQLHYKRGETGLARKHFEKAALLEPSSQLFTDSLQGYHRQELYQSLQHHTGQLFGNPDDLDGRLCAGMICILLERFEVARMHYRRALEIEPGNPLALKNLAALDGSASPPFAKGGRGGFDSGCSKVEICDEVKIPLNPPLQRGTFPATPVSADNARPDIMPLPAPAPEPAEPPTYYGFSRPEVQRLVSRRAKRILDVGCAGGRVGAGLKERLGAEVWGIECNAQAAAAAGRYLDRVVQAPVEQALPQLAKGHFDSIILADVLEHLVDPAAVLAGLSKKLAPNGELIVSLPNVGHWSVLQGLLEGSWEYQDAGILDRTHLKFFTRKSALSLFAAAGFSATSVTPITLSGDTGMPERLLQALQDGGVAGPELSSASATYQYLFRLVRPESLVTSIVILTYNELACTRECLESIARNTPEPHEIILVDNGSSDGTLPYLRELCAGDGHYRLLENGENLGFAAGCNLGMRQARGGRILLLNNDVVVTRGWLGGMLECLEREPGAGIVGPMSNEVAGPQRLAKVAYRSTEELEEFARAFGRSNCGRRIQVPRVVGFCMLFTRELLESVGELDASFGSGNFEDDDFCLRAALAGFGCVLAGDVFIHHYGSRSFKANGIDYARAMATNRVTYDAKWALGRLDEPLAKRIVTRNAITQGRRLARQGRLDQAVDLLLQQGIQFSPKSPEPYRVLAEMLIDAGSFQNALEVLDQIPGEIEVLSLVLAGRCHSGLGQATRARELAELALRRDPESAAALHLNGTLAVGRGEKDRAEALLRAGIAADPGFGPCYTDLAAIAWESGGRDEGLNLAELGFVLSPLSMAALDRWHSLALACDALPREEELVREARAIFPEHQGLAFGLIEILIRRGSYQEAMAHIEQAAADFGMDDAMIDAALSVRDRIGPLTPQKGVRGTISLCMIVKDEARHLPAVLLSVRSLVDEIVVVDTGSSDRSANIARVFGARLFSFPWSGSFSEARNFSLAQASCNWILVLDADEVLSADDLPPLRALLERTGTPTAFSFTTRNYTFAMARKNWTANAGEYPGAERGCGWTPSEKVRLFPNDGRLRFEGAVHELLESSLVACAIPIHACDVPVHHYGKLDTEKSRQKQEQYYHLGLRKLTETGGDATSLAELARQATELERFQEAEELWHKLLLAQPDSAEAYFNLGYLHLVAADYPTARAHALHAVQLAPGMKEAAFNLAKSELFLGNVLQAQKSCQEMLHSWPDYPPALSLYSVSCLIRGDTGDGEAVMARLARLGYDCGDYLEEFAAGFMKGDRGDLALPLLNLAKRVSGGQARLPALPESEGDYASC
jgi:GT2 family glycosyltransferase/2-polyprenyl-3-methyl-5-hydroxy-6-metoxy-1,4-benzoquinol methylase/Flp pilus assembly protein TadD